MSKNMMDAVQESWQAHILQAATVNMWMVILIWTFQCVATVWLL